MSADVLFQVNTAKYQWRFEITVWQGRETFRIWPYYQIENGEWASCKRAYIKGDAPQMSVDDLAALIAALHRYQHGTIKLVA
jgi:hypothetical protein